MYNVQHNRSSFITLNRISYQHFWLSFSGVSLIHSAHNQLIHIFDFDNEIYCSSHHQNLHLYFYYQQQQHSLQLLLLLNISQESIMIIKIVLWWRSQTWSGSCWYYFCYFSKDSTILYQTNRQLGLRAICLLL